jgi:hypothetical protein
VIRGSVRGQAELRHVQGQISVALPRLIAKATPGVRAEIRKLQPDIKAEAAKSLPHRGGYAVVMSRSVGARTAVKATATRITATADVSARGKTEERDVAAVNRGRLRHPVFGRRRAPWKVTTVLPGFVDRPIDRAGDRIAEVVRDARDSVADDIVRG